MNLFYVAIEQSDSQLEVELKKADVVCIVYAVDDEDTLDSGILYMSGPKTTNDNHLKCLYYRFLYRK